MSFPEENNKEELPEDLKKKFKEEEIKPSPDLFDKVMKEVEKRKKKKKDQ